MAPEKEIFKPIPGGFHQRVRVALAGESWTYSQQFESPEKAGRDGMQKEAQAALEVAIRQSLQQQDLPEAARKILEGYGSEIFTYLLRSLRNEADASEVFSQFCERLWRGLATFEGRSLCRTWLYRLATNARADFWQDPHRRRTRRLQTDEISKLEQQVRSRTLGESAEKADRFARLREALSRDERTLLELRIEREMSWQAIAEILTGPEESTSEEALKLQATALRQRFQRLKDKIRRLAEAEGLTENR